MTAVQRIALARAFERLAERIAAHPVVPVHPVIKARKSRVVNRSRRGTNQHRRTANIAE